MGERKDEGREREKGLGEKGGIKSDEGEWKKNGWRVERERGKEERKRKKQRQREMGKRKGGSGREEGERGKGERKRKRKRGRRGTGGGKKGREEEEKRRVTEGNGKEIRWGGGRGKRERGEEEAGGKHITCWLCLALLQLSTVVFNISKCVFLGEQCVRSQNKSRRSVFGINNFHLQTYDEVYIFTDTLQNKKSIKGFTCKNHI
jgi:hypothetical protein